MIDALSFAVGEPLTTLALGWSASLLVARAAKRRRRTDGATAETEANG